MFRGIVFKLRGEVSMFKGIVSFPLHTGTSEHNTGPSGQAIWTKNNQLPSHQKKSG
jgi:hypothetical protein